MRGSDPADVLMFEELPLPPSHLREFSASQVWRTIPMHV